MAGNLGGSNQFLQIRLKNEANLGLFFFFRGSMIFVAPFLFGSSNAYGNFEVYPLNSALSGLGF